MGSLAEGAEPGAARFTRGPAALPAGGVISYVGSSGSSPSRTSPVSLCSDSSNGSSQSGSQPFPTYFPPSPTGSLQDSRAYSGGSLAPREDGSPSSSSSSSSSLYGSSVNYPGAQQVPVDERRRSSPSKAGSTVTSEWGRCGALRVVCVCPPHRGGHPAHSRSSAELNGMVLLCKVCGDVASGFHYGVHACEGCKVPGMGLGRCRAPAVLGGAPSDPTPPRRASSAAASSRTSSTRSASRTRTAPSSASTATAASSAASRSACWLACPVTVSSALAPPVPPEPWDPVFSAMHSLQGWDPL